MPIVEAAAAITRSCTACGATVELGPSTVSTSCSYCGSKLVDRERATVAIQRVAPFRIPKSVATATLKAELAGHIWAPEPVRRNLVRSESIRGVLIPFWSYRGNVQSRYSAAVGIHWYRTETYRDSGGKIRTRMVQETEWFPLSGSTVLRLEDHLVSASLGLPEQEANELEPFDLGHAVGFDPHLLAGWEAELPSVERSRADQTAVDEVQANEKRRIVHELLPGDVNTLEQVSCDVALEPPELVLLPVWAASYRFAGKPYRLLVNGQTGHCVGSVPTSVTKVVLTVLGILMLIAIGLFIAQLGGRR